MSKLSLTARKNIKDNEPKLQANQKSIAAKSGVTFEVEVDWLVIAPVAEERGYKDRVGEIIYDWYLSALASSVENFCKDPIQKESFVETFGEKKSISFVIEMETVEGHDYDYSWVVNNGGVLEIHLPKERFCSNVSNLGSDLAKACSGDGPMSVLTRKNIKDNESSRVKHLKTITTASGLTFDVEADWVVLAGVSKDRGYEDRVGEVIYSWYLEALASSVTNFCKDPIQKESFVETFGEKKSITFVVEMETVEGHEYDYSWVVNNGGVLEIHLPKERFCSNVSNLGSDLAKACSGDGPMSVLTRKNIKDNESLRVKHLKTITTASGITFDVEADWVVLAGVCKDRGYEDRVGEVIYGWYLEALASSVTNFCKDPIQKESFVEAFGEKKSITFVIEMETVEGHEYDYSWVVNNGGVLEIHLPKERFCSNVSNLGSDLAKACSGDGPMSVLTRKNIKDTEPARVKHLKRIEKALGIAFDLEVDWAAFAVLAKDRGYEDRIGEIIHEWYLDALANSLEKLCKDDMSKEAVQESCEKKTITFVIKPTDDMEGKYSCVHFVDGVLTISVCADRFCSNVSSCGEDIESRL